jgi:hypothetical protein
MKIDSQPKISYIPCYQPCAELICSHPILFRSGFRGHLMQEANGHFVSKLRPPIQALSPTGIALIFLL